MSPFPHPHVQILQSLVSQFPIVLLSHDPLRRTEPGLVTTREVIEQRPRADETRANFERHFVGRVEIGVPISSVAMRTRDSPFFVRDGPSDPQTCTRLIVTEKRGPRVREEVGECGAEVALNVILRGKRRRLFDHGVVEEAEEVFACGLGLGREFDVVLSSGILFDGECLVGMGRHGE